MNRLRRIAWGALTAVGLVVMWFIIISMWLAIIAALLRDPSGFWNTPGWL